MEGHSTRPILLFEGMLDILLLFSIKVWLWHDESVGKLARIKWEHMISKIPCSSHSSESRQETEWQSDKDSSWVVAGWGWPLTTQTIFFFFWWHMLLWYWQRGMELVAQNERQYKKLKHALEILSQHKMWREKLQEVCHLVETFQLGGWQKPCEFSAKGLGSCEYS